MISAEIKKWCPSCRAEKGLDLFHPDQKGTYKRHGYCRDCANAKKRAAYRRRYKIDLEYTKRMNSTRRENQWKAYGIQITQAEYDQLMIDQNGVCKICKQTDRFGRSLAVDHDHSNGKVRGLLCTTCNQTLGAFKDSPERFLEAARYLTEESK